MPVQSTNGEPSEGGKGIKTTPAGLGGGKTGFSESKWSRNRENLGFPGSKWFKKYLSAFLKPVTRADSKAIFGKRGVRPCGPENAGKGGGILGVGPCGPENAGRGGFLP